MVSKAYWPSKYISGYAAVVALAVAGASVEASAQAIAEPRAGSGDRAPAEIRQSVIGRSRLGRPASGPAGWSQRRVGLPSNMPGLRPRVSGARGGIVADGATITRAEQSATLGEAAAVAVVIGLGFAAWWRGFLSRRPLRSRLSIVAGDLAMIRRRPAGGTSRANPTVTTKHVFAALRSAGKPFRKTEVRRDGGRCIGQEEVQQI